MESNMKTHCSGSNDGNSGGASKIHTFRKGIKVEQAQMFKKIKVNQ
jgi:hypothetical protein